MFGAPMLAMNAGVSRVLVSGQGSFCKEWLEYLLSKVPDGFRAAVW
jgi:hypothetical protein